MNDHRQHIGRNVSVLCILVFMLTSIIPTSALGISTVQPLSPGPVLAPKSYYVNGSGLDTNDGSAAHPFREIRKALTVVAPGDTVLVSNGTYLGFDIKSQHGTINAWITITAPEHNATINVTTDRSDNRDTVFITDSSFFIIDGLRSFNANRAAMRIDSSNNITVSNVTFGNNAVWGIFTDFSDDTIIENSELYGSGSQHGIYFSNSPDHPIARNNTIHDNFGCGIHNNGDISMGGDGLVQSALIENNIIYNNGAGGGAGINMDGAQGSTVRNNILYNNHASGITVYHGDASSGPLNDKYYHNTIDMPADGRYALQIQGSVGPVMVRNNILYNRNPNHGGLSYGDANDVANTDSDYNVMDRMTPDDWNTLLTLAQWQAQGHETHSFSALPSALFVDYNNRDYHLSSNSSAIDKGQNISTVVFDRDNNPRPSGNASDIGAYEFQQAIIPDITPPDPIIDLAASNATLTTIDVSWTATGDDAKVGTASSYDLRYSRSNILDANWASATKVTGLPKPLAAGSKQSFKVTGLTTDTKYFFAIKATDDKNNIAALSNIASATTLKIIPDLSIAQKDIVFNNTDPLEGDIVTVTATIRSINITEKLNFFVELRADNLTCGNKSISLNATWTNVAFNWISDGGNISLSVVVDSSNVIKETNETNNMASKTITVRFPPPPPKPDLFITRDNISIPNAYNLKWTDTVNITVTINAVNFTSEALFYMTLSANGVVLSNLSVDLNKTQVKEFSFQFKRGYYCITVQLDTSNTVQEGNESNNAASRIIIVSGPEIYVLPSDFHIDTGDIFVGDNLSIDVLAHSMNGWAVPNVRVLFFMDKVLLGNTTMNFTTGGNWVSTNWTATLGHHNVTIKLDPFKALDEENVDDNVASLEFNVKARPPPDFDLYIKGPDIDMLTEPKKEGDKVPLQITFHMVNIPRKLNVTVFMYHEYVFMEKRTVYTDSPSNTMLFYWTAVKGIHNVTFKVTAEYKIDEPNTSNNIATAMIIFNPKAEKPHNAVAVSNYIMIGAIVAAVAAGVAGVLIYKRRRKDQAPPASPGGPA